MLTCFGRGGTGATALGLTGGEGIGVGVGMGVGGMAGGTGLGLTAGLGPGLRRGDGRGDGRMRRRSSGSPARLVAQSVTARTAHRSWSRRTTVIRIQRRQLDFPAARVRVCLTRTEKTASG